MIVPVSVFYAEPCCWVHIHKAESQNHDHRRSLQTVVSASVYVPVCDTLLASTLPGIEGNAGQNRHIRATM